MDFIFAILGVLALIALIVIPRTSLVSSFDKRFEESDPKTVKKRESFEDVKIVGKLLAFALAFLGAVSIVRLAAPDTIVAIADALGATTSGVVAALGVVVAIALSGFIIVRPPDWSQDLSKSTWTATAVVAALIGSAVSIAAGLELKLDSELAILAIIMGASCLSVIMVFSMVTDFRLRLVDRRQMNIASLLTAVFSAAHLTSPLDPMTITLSIALLVFAGILYVVFINAIGASDARALCLVAVAAVPAIGWEGFVWASLLAGVSFIVIGFGVAFVKRTTKSSMPAVPMMLFPYWAVVVAELFINLPLMLPTYA